MCVLIQYWSDINSSVWIILFILLTCVIGMSLIRVYGTLRLSCSHEIHQVLEVS